MHHRYVLKEIMKAKDLLHETYISFLIGQVLAVILIKVKTLVSDNTPACRPLEKGRTKGAGWMLLCR